MLCPRKSENKGFIKMSQSKKIKRMPKKKKNEKD